MNKNNYYYNMNDLESFGAKVTAVFGERGNGKSFSGKNKMIKHFLKTGRCSCYVRRTKTELEGVMIEIFNDMFEHYPELEFTFEGSSKTGYYYAIDGKPFCYLFALSTAGQLRGVSYPNIDFMFFDEYVPEDGKFLKNEHIKITSLMSTIFRDRPNFRVHFASNSVTYVCPLLDIYGIQPRSNKRFWKRKVKTEDGETKILFVLEITQDSDYRKNMIKSELGLTAKLAGVDRYMYSNEVLLDNDEHISPQKPAGYDFFLCCFVIGNDIYGCWTNDNSNGFYVYEKYEKNNFRNLKFYIFKEDKKEGWLDIKNYRNIGNIKAIKQFYGEGRVQFKNQKIKRTFMEDIIKYI